MSLSKRVNVFLERARQLQSASPKLSKKPPSPVKSNSPYEPKPTSPTTSIKQTSIENDLVQNLETMIETFLKTRTETSKRLDLHKQKESKFIEGIKKSLEFEIEKKKSSGLLEMEKEFKEKTEKVLMIVKQEALNVDKKLVEMQNENLKLKQALSEKNIEVIDKKIMLEISTIWQVLDHLAKQAGGKGFIKVDQLLELKGNVFDGSLDFEVEEIIGEDECLTNIIASEILDRENEWKEKLSRLESEIELRRKKYKKLDRSIKKGPKKPEKKHESDEEEFFGHRETRSDTFGCVPVQPKRIPEVPNTDSEPISAEEVLAKIYSEILASID